MTGLISGGSTMTEGNESKSILSMLADEPALEWMDEHVTELRHSVSGQHFLYWGLAISFVVGLAAHIGGYVLLRSTPGEPLGLLADLLHALGLALWTGAVVAVLVQVIPEAKRRQIKSALDAYEALQRDKAMVNSNHETAALERSPVRSAERKQGQKGNQNRVRKGRQVKEASRHS
jgi:hypothetical protein